MMDKALSFPRRVASQWPHQSDSPSIKVGDHMGGHLYTGGKLRVLSLNCRGSRTTLPDVRGDQLGKDSTAAWMGEQDDTPAKRQAAVGRRIAAGTHILIDGQIAGQPHKLVTHSARNGFLYAFERTNGQTLLAKPYMEAINWTKGIGRQRLPVRPVPRLDQSPQSCQRRRAARAQ